MKNNHQNGFAMLVPMLLAITVTGGTVVAVEQISDTQMPILSAALTGQKLNDLASTDSVVAAAPEKPVHEATPK